MEGGGVDGRRGVERGQERGFERREEKRGEDIEMVGVRGQEGRDQGPGITFLPLRYHQGSTTHQREQVDKT